MTDTPSFATKTVQLESGRVVNARVLEKRHQGTWKVQWAGLTLEAMPLLPVDILNIEQAGV